MDGLVTSVLVTTIGSHDHVRVWVRGGLAGELVVSAGDGVLLAKLLGMIAVEPVLERDVAGYTRVVLRDSEGF